MAIFDDFPGVPREMTKNAPDARHFSGGFLRFFQKKMGFWRFWGLPVIKEEKAIAVRTIDIFRLFVLLRNAMATG